MNTALLRYVLLRVYSVATATSGPGPPHSRGFYVTHNDAPKSVGLSATSDQLVAETSYRTIHNNYNRQTSPVGFGPTISADKRPQTYALDRAATGMLTESVNRQNFTAYRI